MPTVTIEGCGNPTDGISLGFTTQYWGNDGDDFISIDCQENIGSMTLMTNRQLTKGYKIRSAHPTQYGHRVPHSVSEYRLRYTAFTVRIMDQLAG